MTQAGLPLALKAVAIRPGVLAVAVRVVVLPFADVFVTLLALPDAVAVLLSLTE